MAGLIRFFEGSECYQYSTKNGTVESKGKISYQYPSLNFINNFIYQSVEFEDVLFIPIFEVNENWRRKVVKMKLSGNVSMSDDENFVVYKFDSRDFGDKIQIVGKRDLVFIVQSKKDLEQVYRADTNRNVIRDANKYRGKFLDEGANLIFHNRVINTNDMLRVFTPKGKFRGLEVFGTEEIKLYVDNKCLNLSVKEGYQIENCSSEVMEEKFKKEMCIFRSRK